MSKKKKPRAGPVERSIRYYRAQERRFSRELDAEEIRHKLDRGLIWNRLIRAELLRKALEVGRR